MKQPVSLRMDERLVSAIDKFIKKIIPKKNRTQFMEDAAKDHLRREKKKLYRESK